MLKFIFNTIQNRRNERLINNSRQSIGSKKSFSNGSKYESWQNTHNKNTLTSSPCFSGDCNGVVKNCVPNPDKSNSCPWKCICEGYNIYPSYTPYTSTHYSNKYIS